MEWWRKHLYPATISDIASNYIERIPTHVLRINI